MFSYVFMKILEGRPRSYDRRMDRVSRGRVRELKQAVAAEVPDGSRVLEIGCGTGELAEMLVSGRSATVNGFDRSLSMVTVAQERIKAGDLGDRLSVRQMGVDGMDGLPDSVFDAVVSTLVLSELTPDERRYALRHAHRALRPGGCLVIADEVLPRTSGRRLVQALVRAPLVAATYLATRSSTRPISDLAGEVDAAGFEVVKEERSHGDAMVLLVARRVPMPRAKRSVVGPVRPRRGGGRGCGSR